jgi:hypothetical protein
MSQEETEKAPDEVSPEGEEVIPAPKGELESRVAELEEVLGEAQTTLKAQEEEASTLRERLALAAAKYRSLLLASNPEVPEELVGGETVDRVRRRLEAKLEQEPRYIGAGAPPRTAPDLSDLSPREKIAYGLARR